MSVIVRSKKIRKHLKMTNSWRIEVIIAILMNPKKRKLYSKTD